MLIVWIIKHFVVTGNLEFTLEKVASDFNHSIEPISEYEKYPQPFVS